MEETKYNIQEILSAHGISDAAWATACADLGHTTIRITRLLYSLSVVPGSLEDILEGFKKSVAEKGYNGIDDSVIPIVGALGTTLDKAVLCANAYFDMNRDGKKPKMSKSEMEIVRKSIRKQGQKVMDEFTDYLIGYDALMDLSNYFYRKKYEYLHLAQKFAVYVQAHEALRLADKVQAVLPDIEKAKLPDEAAAVRDALVEVADGYRSFGEFTHKGKDSFHNFDRECVSFADSIREEAAHALSVLKGISDGMEKWLADNGSEMFVPMEFRQERYWVAIQGGYIPEIKGKYYADKGGKDDIDGIRSFLCYEGVKADKNSMEFTMNKLDEYAKEVRG